MYYACVTSWIYSTFSIVATVTDITKPAGIATLTNGMPQFGYLPEQNYMYFSYAVGDTSSPFSITVETIFGSVNVFVRDDGQTPSTTYAQWNTTGQVRHLYTC